MLVVPGAVAPVSNGSANAADVSPLLIDHPQAVESRTDWEFPLSLFVDGGPTVQQGPILELSIIF